MPGTTRSGGDRRSKGEDPFPQDGKPQPPKGLSAAERRAWDEMLAFLPPVILRRVDAVQLAILVRLIIRERALGDVCRRDPADLPASRAHLGVVQAISRLSVQFGLSPADRRRIRIDQPVEEESVFSELLARMSGKN